MPRMDYEQRVADRRERLENAAERASANAAAAFKRADMSEAATGIPFGQPILVGHHSEKRHRATIDRAWAAMGKSVAESKKADYYANAAASVGTAGVSSDDPNGIDKLTAKVAELEALQARMKAANKLLATLYKTITAAPEAWGVCLDGMAPIGITEAMTVRLISPRWKGDRETGFQPFTLTNNSAVIRSTKKRIEQLKAGAGAETKTIETNVGVTVIENAEENRVQIVFPGKPDEATRTILKSYGFRWSPTEGAWQRLLNNAARWAAQQVIRQLTPTA